MRIGDCKPIVAAGLLLAATVVARAETIDRVLAVAGGQVIMLSDVNAARAFGLVPGSDGADPIAATLSRLIDRELVLIEVERYAPAEPAADAIDREVAAIRARFPSDAAYKAALATSGIGEDRLRDEVRNTLRIQTYLDQRFAGADTEERRSALINDWMAGLRRRADIINLYAGP